MREIGTFEAKNKLGQVLDWVQAGEEVVITRRGRAVARVVPPRPAFDADRARAAARRIRAMRQGVGLGGLRLDELIDEGRL